VGRSILRYYSKDSLGLRKTMTTLQDSWSGTSGVQIKSRYRFSSPAWCLVSVDGTPVCVAARGSDIVSPDGHIVFVLFTYI
jgi:hypothetical protein